MLGVSMNAEQRIAVEIFRLELFLIVLHEWTHVVHGRVRKAADAGFANEVLARNDGNIEQQARESDADGYAAYHMSENIINGQERAHIVSVLAMGDKTSDVQESCCFAASSSRWPPNLFTCETPKGELRNCVHLRASATGATDESADERQDVVFPESASAARMADASAVSAADEPARGRDVGHEWRR